MKYKYEGINQEGKKVEDSVDAQNYHELISFLHKKGIIPTHVQEEKSGVGSSFMIKFSAVSLQDKILFVQNLSIMLKAGIPLTKGIRILANQAKNPKMKAILTDVYNQVEAGKTIAESLEKYPHDFPNIFVSMFRIGEMSGTLEKSLEQLTIQLQREHELVSKTKGAMIYPAVVVFAIVVVGILMSIFVLPSLTAIFKDANIPLPLMTRMIIGFTDLMSHHTLLVLGSLCIIVGGFILAMRTEKGNRIFDKVLLRMPSFGKIAKKVNMARFSRTVSSMLKSGTPILESLSVASDAMGNYEYRDAIKKAAQDVKMGKSLNVALGEYPHLFDYLVLQMIGVGEESGNVETVLQEMAEHFEAEVDDTMKNLSSIIEPVILLVIGGAVGILAVGLMSPIYSLTNYAGK